MKQYFYSHIIETESLLIALNKMVLSEKEKVHLLSLIDSSLHHTVLDAILSELSESDKRVFLTHVVSNEHDKLWNHLNEKVDNIEDKIKTAANQLKKQLHDDIIDAASPAH
ncbi:hypothetical protein BH11PAT1_BH11PAT1_3540 [soil metagenome]